MSLARLMGLGWASSREIHTPGACLLVGIFKPLGDLKVLPPEGAHAMNKQKLADSSTHKDCLLEPSWRHRPSLFWWLRRRTLLPTLSSLGLRHSQKISSSTSLFTKPGEEGGAEKQEDQGLAFQTSALRWEALLSVSARQRAAQPSQAHSPPKGTLGIGHFPPSDQPHGDHLSRLATALSFKRGHSMICGHAAHRLLLICLAPNKALRVPCWFLSLVMVSSDRDLLQRPRAREGMPGIWESWPNTQGQSANFADKLRLCGVNHPEVGGQNLLAPKLMLFLLCQVTSHSHAQQSWLICEFKHSFIHACTSSSQVYWVATVSQQLC